MSIGIGIDTGGTYTDCVIYDFKNKSILASAKSLTTRDDLSIGICNVLNLLPHDLLSEADLLCLSTTLATNACVENTGSRAKLVLIGYDLENYKSLDISKKYRLALSDLLFVENDCSYDGLVVNHPDWKSILKDESPWFNDAQSIALSATYATRNGAICEKVAKKEIQNRYNLPVVIATEVADNLNVIERGVTAQLNAKLISTIEKFIYSTEKSLSSQNLNLKTMIVRSDGSLMNLSSAASYPVCTILSGPAASVVGARGLTNCSDSIIVDIGGTTTDIALVKNNSPIMTEHICIGGFKTQIKGVDVTTFALGGDSRIFLNAGKLQLDTRRAVPLCVAANKHPHILDALKKLVKSETFSLSALHEFYMLVNKPSDIRRYNFNEVDFINRLKKNDNILGLTEVDNYGKKYERLEAEGIIIRCGLTPTDIMHIKGDFTAHNAEASLLGVRFLLQRMAEYEDTPSDVEKFCDEIYNLICKKLYSNIVRVLLSQKHPQQFAEGMPPAFEMLIEQSWHDKNHSDNLFFSQGFSTSATLIGIGAPTHIFLKKVSKALSTDCIIPEYASVANAVGAVIADISANAVIMIEKNCNTAASKSYIINSANECIEFDDIETAIIEATKLATSQAVLSAKARGAIGELTIEIEQINNQSVSALGTQVYLSTVIKATASGRI